MFDKDKMYLEVGENVRICTKDGKVVVGYLLCETQDWYEIRTANSTRQVRFDDIHNLSVISISDMVVLWQLGIG